MRLFLARLSMEGNCEPSAEMDDRGRGGKNFPEGERPDIIRSYAVTDAISYGCLSPDISTTAPFPDTRYPALEREQTTSPIFPST